MANFVFGKILTDVLTSDSFNKTKEVANRWFMRKTSGFRGSEKSITTLPHSESQKVIRGEMIGNLYFFKYNPKTKDQLKYWDGFPLVLPIETTPLGFLGINFHYLPHKERAILMDYLMELERKSAHSTLIDKAGVLEKRFITYNHLSAYSKYKYFKPALKHYHYSNITSRMVELNKAEWKVALFLPVEDFQKQNTKTIWNDTKKKIRKLR